MILFTANSSHRHAQRIYAMYVVMLLHVLLTICFSLVKPLAPHLLSAFSALTCISCRVLLMNLRRFVTAAGADPSAHLQRLAQDQGMGDKLHMISLGQGQGPLAQAVIEMAAKQGMQHGWWLTPLRRAVAASGFNCCCVGACRNCGNSSRSWPAHALCPVHMW